MAFLFMSIPLLLVSCIVPLSSSFPSDPMTNYHISNNPNYDSRPEYRFPSLPQPPNRGGSGRQGGEPTFDQHYNSRGRESNPTRHNPNQPHHNQPEYRPYPPSGPGRVPNWHDATPPPRTDFLMPGISSHTSQMDPHLVPQHMNTHTSGKADRVDMSEDTQQQAFKGCERHGPAHNVASSISNGKFESEPVPMQHHSHMAIYPLSDNNGPVYLKINMKSSQYKVKIQGTNVVLERCSAEGLNCHEIEEKGVKDSDIISPQKWNYVYSQIETNKIVIGVNDKVEVMAMDNIPEQELDTAEWLMTSGDGVRSADGQPDGWPFTVQYPCAEYVAMHLSTTTPHTAPPYYGGHTTTPSHGGHRHFTTPPFYGGSSPQYPRDTDDHETNYTNMDLVTMSSINGTINDKHTGGGPQNSGHVVTIVLGVVVALLLVGLLVAVAVSVYHKREANKRVNEATPLSKTNEQQQRQ